MSLPTRTRPLPLAPILRRYHQGYPPNGAEMDALVTALEQSDPGLVDAGLNSERCPSCGAWIPLDVTGRRVRHRTVCANGLAEGP